MIRKQDILDRATDWGIRAEVIEKDYVLGWVLAAFASHPVASASWTFKGGTCVKKCFFETYRFSEDLDFSLTPEAPYDAQAVRTVLTKVMANAAEMSGIRFPPERIELKARRDKLGRGTYQGRVAYQGPLAVPSWPRLVLDITQHEVVVAPPARRSIFHPYPDGLPDGSGVLCYSLEELFAEKTRALLERTRPRDLYDVVHLWDRREELQIELVRRVLQQKCTAKHLEPPTTAGMVALVRDSAELRADWSNMLEHQLAALPLVDSVLARLDEVLGWIDAPLAPPAAPPRVRVRADEARVAPRGGHFWGGPQRLEIVRFAGANRLKIAFTYHGIQRVAEPYSLRRKATDNLLLYAWEDGAQTIKAFKVAEMRDVKVTNKGFVPRFRVELTG